MYKRRRNSRIFLGMIVLALAMCSCWLAITVVRTGILSPLLSSGAVATPHAGGLPLVLVAEAPTLLPTSAAGEPAAVVHIVDGDTIDVVIAGRQERVRYVGMDTPERAQPGYRAATEANRLLVEGQSVLLARDISDRDRNGRLLRFAFLADGRLVNAELIAQGWAQPLEYSPDITRAPEFRQLAVAAALARRGFWSGASAYDDVMSYGFTQQDTVLRTEPSGRSTAKLTIDSQTPLTVYGRTRNRFWLQVRTPARAGGWVEASTVWLNVDASTVPEVKSK